MTRERAVPRPGKVRISATAEAPPATPSVGTLIEQLLGRVHALEVEVQRLAARVSDLEGAARPQ